MWVLFLWVFFVRFLKEGWREREEEGKERRKEGKGIRKILFLNIMKIYFMGFWFL